MKPATQSAIIAAISNHVTTHDAAPVTMTVGRKVESYYVEIIDAPHSVISGIFTWLEASKKDHFATAHLHGGKLVIS